VGTFEIAQLNRSEFTLYWRLPNQHTLSKPG
jgi:hypothetical protein